MHPNNSGSPSPPSTLGPGRPGVVSNGLKDPQLTMLETILECAEGGVYGANRSVRVVFVAPPHSGLKGFMNWAAERTSARVLRPSTMSTDQLTVAWRNESRSSNSSGAVMTGTAAALSLRTICPISRRYTDFQHLMNRLVQRQCMLKRMGTEIYNETIDNCLRAASPEAGPTKPSLLFVSGSVLCDGIASTNAARSLQIMNDSQALILNEVVHQSFWLDEQLALPKSTTLYVYIKPHGKSYRTMLQEKKLKNSNSVEIDACLQIRKELDTIFTRTDLSRLMNRQVLCLKQDFSRSPEYCLIMLEKIIDHLYGLHMNRIEKKWGTGVTRDVVKVVVNKLVSFGNLWPQQQHQEHPRGRSPVAQSSRGNRKKSSSRNRSNAPIAEGRSTDGVAAALTDESQNGSIGKLSALRPLPISAASTTKSSGATVIEAANAISAAIPDIYTIPALRASPPTVVPEAYQLIPQSARSASERLHYTNSSSNTLSRTNSANLSRVEIVNIKHATQY